MIRNQISDFSITDFSFFISPT